MEKQIKNLVEQYFPADAIDSIKLFGKRVIITLHNIAEDETKLPNSRRRSPAWRASTKSPLFSPRTKNRRG